MSEFARTPAPPYYAVIFSTTRTAADPVGYAAAAERMLSLAREQPGYLGVEAAHGEDGLGITISYWESLEAIAGWRRNAEHLAVQASGRERWYAHYELRVARVERAQGFQA